MSRDVPETVHKLLLLAAGNENDNEASAAALQAARLFKSARLRLSETDPASERCIMCQPATTPGQCYRCGVVGDGPGHHCLSPEPGTLCKVHASWRSTSARGSFPTSPYGYASPSPFSPFDMPFYARRPVSEPYGPPVGPYPRPPVSPSSTVERSLSEELEKVQLRLRRAERKARRLERENRNLRAGLPPPVVVAEDQGSSVQSPKVTSLTADQESALFCSIDQLSLSTRSRNALANCYGWKLPAGKTLEYVGGLAQFTENDLLRIKNLGRKCVREIRSCLRTLGLDLGMQIPDWFERLDRWKRKESAA